MRKIISVLLGVPMVIGGLAGFLYMFFHVVQPVSLLIWAAPISVFAFGRALLWEDITEALKRQQS